jgi:hypothetical protein
MEHCVGLGPIRRFHHLPALPKISKVYKKILKNSLESLNAFLRALCIILKLQFLNNSHPMIYPIIIASVAGIRISAKVASP